MAKRRRLTPGFDLDSSDIQDGEAAGGGAGRTDTTGGPPPIARVAGDAARDAAFEEVAQALGDARAEGRLILRLPLDAIEDGYLVRDRLAAPAGAAAGPGAAEMAALVDSIRADGQRMPVEVAVLPGGRHGLISGWRRLTALRRLHAETGEARFATVLALPRTPASIRDAYRAMIDENELRADLSHYERARIVALAAAAGGYADEQAALSALFATASRPRRSKIGSFLRLYHALDGVLSHPAAIPERLGLALVRRIDAEGPAGIVAALRAAAPGDAAAEIAVLDRAARPPAHQSVHQSDRPSRPVPSRPVRPDIALRVEGPGRVTLQGDGVDAAFLARLETWLRDAQG